MTKEEAALLVSFVAMGLVVVSYFFKKKNVFLILQSVAIGFLILSYLFTGEYFAMIGIGIGLIRTLVYFAYERNMQETPLYWTVTFCLVTVAAYFTVNFWVLGEAKPLDVLYLASLILYAIVFRIRDLKWMRRLAIIPITLALAYNIFANSTPFILASYSLELAANLAAILKFEIFDLRNIRGTKKEKKEE